VVDQRRQALQAAQAAVLQAEGTLKRAELDVEFTKVRAPIDGRISRHLVTVATWCRQRERRHAADVDRLDASNLRLFRHG